MNDGKPAKVAVIGGGCAAMAAAFELTRPEHAGRFEVTVYQLGWRLGGKGASGRGPADRIEEHGLHLWMGWYENAFRLMRECYAELGRTRDTCPIADWRDAFTPVQLAGLTDRTPDGRWEPWQATLPPGDGLPGDPPSAAQRLSVVGYMGRAIGLVRGLLETLADDAPAAAPVGGAPGQATSGLSVERIFEALGSAVRYGEVATLTGLLQAFTWLEMALGAVTDHPPAPILRVLDVLGSSTRHVLDARLRQEPAVRRIWQVIDLTLATMRGVIRAGIITDPRGFDAIDEYDCREWLRLNGAAESSLESGWLRALYDFGFSYEDGDPQRPRIAASQGLRAMVRAFFTYRGAFFWRMQAGMGDIVFAPFYEVLRRRGVRFAFFHRLDNLRLGPSGTAAKPYVDALEFAVQAEVRDGAEYAPLVSIRGLPCWPAHPDYGQLVDGDRFVREGWEFESHWDRRCVGHRTLQVGTDFDFVVLGVGLGAIPHVGRELVARDPRWRAMVDHVKTVATQAFQIWMHPPMEALGWRRGQTVVSGFVEPFDTWADMRHLLEAETWPTPCESLAYFCNVLPDGGSDAGNPEAADYPQRQRARVRDNAIRFLNRDIGHLWPDAARDGEFRWDLLVDPAGGAAVGSARFASQYWTANVNPSDRYALSLPGSGAYRISPLDETYDNLTIAGDWTHCGFNAGCVEAAVISGRLAAHALAQTPALEDIVGFDHP